MAHSSGSRAGSSADRRSFAAPRDRADDAAEYGPAANVPPRSLVRPYSFFAITIAVDSFGRRINRIAAPLDRNALQIEYNLRPGYISHDKLSV